MTNAMETFLNNRELHELSIDEHIQLVRKIFEYELVFITDIGSKDALVSTDSELASMTRQEFWSQCNEYDESTELLPRQSVEDYSCEVREFFDNCEDFRYGGNNVADELGILLRMFNPNDSYEIYDADEVIQDLNLVLESLERDFYHDFRCTKCHRWIARTHNLEEYYPLELDELCEDCFQELTASHDGWYCAKDAKCLDQYAIGHNRCKGCSMRNICERDAFENHIKEKLKEIPGASWQLYNTESAEFSTIWRYLNYLGVNVEEIPTDDDWYLDRDECIRIANLNEDAEIWEWRDWAVGRCDDIINQALED